MKKTLLEQAKATPRRWRRRLDADPAETLELALAYARKEITSVQAGRALGLEGRGASNAHNILAQRLMKAAREWEIEIRRRKP